MDWKYLRIEEDKLAPIQDMEFFVNSLSGQKQPRGRSTTTTLNAMISDKVKPPTKGELLGIPKRFINIASPKRPNKIDGIAARLFIFISINLVNLLSSENSSK